MPSYKLKANKTYKAEKTYVGFREVVPDAKSSDKPNRKTSKYGIFEELQDGGFPVGSSASFSTASISSILPNMKVAKRRKVRRSHNPYMLNQIEEHPSITRRIHDDSKFQLIVKHFIPNSVEVLSVFYDNGQKVAVFVDNELIELNQFNIIEANVKIMEWIVNHKIKGIGLSKYGLISDPDDLFVDKNLEIPNPDDILKRMKSVKKRMKSM